MNSRTRSVDVGPRGEDDDRRQERREQDQPERDAVDAEG